MCKATFHKKIVHRRLKMQQKIYGVIINVSLPSQREGSPKLCSLRQLPWWNFWGTRPGCGLDDGQLLIICQHTEVLPLWEQGRWLFTVNSRGIGSRSNLCHTMLLCARRFRGGNNTFIAGRQKDGIKLWWRPVTLWCFFPLLQCVIKVSRLLLLMSLKRLSPEEVKLTGSWKQYRADQRYSERCCCRCMGLTETGARTEHLRQRSWETDVFDEH